MPTITEALTQAFAHHQRGELAQADQLYRQVLDAEPGHADAWHLLGVSAHQAGRHQEAVDAINRALAIGGENPLFLNHLGAAYAGLDRLDEAEDAFRRAMAIQTHDPQVHYNLAALLNLRGRKEEAIESYRRAIALAPKFAEAQFNLGNLLRDAGDHVEAEKCYAAALAARPKYTKAAMALANAQLRLGKKTGAESTYRLALQFDPKNIDARYWLGSLYQSENRLEEAATELQAVVVANPQHVQAQNNLGCVFRAMGRLDQAEQCFRLALHAQPDFAEGLSNLGSVLHDRRQLDDAADMFRRALAARPDFVQALNNLGTVLQEQKKFDEAEQHYRRALELEPDSAEGLVNAGSVLQMKGETDEAIAYYHRAIASNPELPRAHYCLAAALHFLGRDEEALAAYAEAVRLKPEYAEAHYNRSFVYLSRGDLAEGWKGYEWRFRCKEYKGRKFKEPVWDGSPLGDRTLLVHAEQGLGDTLQFIRYAKQVLRAGGRVYVEVQPALAPLLKASGVTGIIPGGAPLPRFDLHIALMSLPGVLGTTLATIPAEVPYLSADPRLLKHWRSPLRNLRGTYKVGIVWQGNPDYAFDRFRSVPLKEFAPLADVPGVQLISLQKTHGLDQLASLAGAFHVVDLGSQLDATSGPFMDTAAVMCNLDLVIASDTAAAHLAGGLGVPVWVPLSHSAEWRWLVDREDSPWYPSMRLFRQSQQGDWSDVFVRMKKELAARAAKRSPGR